MKTNSRERQPGNRGSDKRAASPLLASGVYLGFLVPGRSVLLRHINSDNIQESAVFASPVSALMERWDTER